MRYLKTCLVMMVLLMSTAIQSSASVQGKRTVLICMTAKGHSQWLQLTVNVNPVTEVTNIHAGREVQSVQYVNAMGQVSDRPFDGVNIVVTRYTDGTVSTVKTIKN